MPPPTPPLGFSLDAAPARKPAPAPPPGFTLDAPSAQTANPDAYQAATPFGREVYDAANSGPDYDENWLRTQLGKPPAPPPGFKLDADVEDPNAVPPGFSFDMPPFNPDAPWPTAAHAPVEEPIGFGEVLADSLKQTAGEWGDVFAELPTKIGASLTSAIAGIQASQLAELEQPGVPALSPEFEGKTPEEVAAMRRESTEGKLAIARAAGEDLVPTPGRTLAQRGLTTAVTSAAQSAPALAAGLITRNPALAATAMFPTTAGQSFGDIANEYADQDLQRQAEGGAARSEEQRRADLGRAQFHANVQGGLEVATELAPFGKVLARGTPAVKRLAEVLLAELPGETIATLTQAIDDELARAPEGVGQLDSVIRGLEQGGKQIPETLVATILGSAGQTAPVVAAEALARQAAPEAPRAARVEPTMEGGLGDDLAAAPTERGGRVEPTMEPRPAPPTVPLDVEAQLGATGFGDELEAAQAPREPARAPSEEWVADPAAGDGVPFAFLGAEPETAAAYLTEDGEQILATLADGTEVGRFTSSREAALAVEDALAQTSAVAATSATTPPAPPPGFELDAPVGPAGPPIGPPIGPSGFGDVLPEPAAAAASQFTSTPSQEGAGVATAAAPADRRTAAGAAKRKKVADLTLEEAKEELYKHDLTGIRNRRAYDELPKQPTQTAVDVDSLKWINKAMGYESGNELLKAVAEAMREEGGQNAYHLSGDEFVLQGATAEENAAIMERVNERLAGAVISVTMPGGNVVTLSGLGVSYGSGKDLSEADHELIAAKAAREARGERAAHGESPAGASSFAAEEGRQDLEGRPAAEVPAAADEARDRSAEGLAPDEPLAQAETGAFRSLEQRRAQQRSEGEEGDSNAELESQVSGEMTAEERGHTEAVQKMLGGAKNAPRVRFVADTAGIPAHARARLTVTPGRKLAGAYDPKTNDVYLVTGALRSPEHAAWVAAHEIAGHYGLLGFVGKMGKDARARLNSALEIAQQNPTIAALAKSIQSQRTKLSNLQAIEEALAELAAAVRTGNYERIAEKWDVAVPERIRGKVQSAFDRFIERLLAIVRKFSGQPKAFTDENVRELLEGAWRYVQGGKTAKSAKGFGDELELTEEQQQTPAFKKWFGDSKVVDAQGKPLVVYHGTTADVREFRVSKRGTFGAGVYFAEKPDDADIFTPQTGELGENHVPVYLSLQTPYEYTADFNAGEDVDIDSPAVPLVEYALGAKAPAAIARARNGDGNFGEAVRAALIAKGHDGIIVTYEGSTQGSTREFVAFEPSQVKSAIGNAGAFDESADDIAQAEEPDEHLTTVKTADLEASIERLQSRQKRLRPGTVARAEIDETLAPLLREMERRSKEVKVGADVEEVLEGDTEGARAQLKKQIRAKARELADLSNLDDPKIEHRAEAAHAELEELQERYAEAFGESHEAQAEVLAALDEKIARVEAQIKDLEEGIPDPRHKQAMTVLKRDLKRDLKQLRAARDAVADEPKLSEEEPEASTPGKPQAAAGGAGKRYVQMYRSKGAPLAAGPAQVGTAARARVLEVPKKPIRREHVMKLFQRLFKIKIYEGKPFPALLQGRALGFFRPSNFEIRNRDRNDLEVAAHEVFHWLDRTYPEIRKLYHKRRFADELYGVSYDDTKIFEGFAEFGRLFMTQETEAVTRLPTFYEAFVKEARDSGILDKLEEVQKLMHQWYLQGAENRARSKIGSEKAPIRQRLEQMADGFTDRAMASSLDWLQAAKVIERETKGAIAEDAAMSPYKSMRLLAGARSTINTWLNYGTLGWTAKGDLDINGKGLRQIFEPIASVFDETMGLFVALRADELRKYSKEKLFSPDEIAALKERARKTGKLDVMMKAHAEYQNYTKRLLHFAEQSGLLSKETRAIWEEMYQNYVPFYRVAEKFGSLDPRMAGGTRGGLFRRLTGGTANVADVFENITLNTALIVHASLKNVAKRQLFAAIESSPVGQRYAVRIPTSTESRQVAMEQIERALKEFAKNAEAQAASGVADAMEATQMAQLARALATRSNDLGQATMTDIQDQAMFFFTGKPPTIPDKEQVLVNGKPRWYQIGDPMLWDMLTHLNYHQPITLVERVFGVAKRTLTRGVTISPEFQIANILRDTFQAFTLSKGRQWPIVDALKALPDIWKESEDYQLFLANGGGFGNAIGDEAKKLRVRMKVKGVRGVLDTPAALADFWDKWGQSFELATRLAEFKKIRGQGKSMREAAFQGREISTDFAMRGHSQLARWASFSLPFFNARLQGLYRIERELFEKKGRQSWRGERALTYAARAFTGLTMPALLVYWLMNEDDDDYEDLPAEVKSLNTVIKSPDGNGVYLIPRPFETGALFQEIPIRLWEYYRKRDGEKLADAAKFMILNTFNFNPIPQIAAPPSSVLLNRKWNGLPVVPRSLADVEPREQFQPWTPETYKKIGALFNVSPLKLQALIEGYFGTLANYLVAGSDALVTAGGPDEPEKKLSQYPLFRRFMREQPYSNTEFEQRFYDMLDETTIVTNTARLLRRQGRGDDLEQYLAEPQRETYFGLSSTAEDVRQQAADINAQIRAIRSDPETPASQKTREIDELQAAQNALFKEAVQALDAARLEELRDAIERQ